MSADLPKKIEDNIPGAGEGALHGKSHLHRQLVTDLSLVPECYHDDIIAVVRGDKPVLMAMLEIPEKFGDTLLQLKLRLEQLHSELSNI